jgi:hypothetical protein
MQWSVQWSVQCRQTQSAFFAKKRGLVRWFALVCNGFGGIAQQIVDKMSVEPDTTPFSAIS